MEKEIRQQWHFDQAPEEVWEYLTKPELIEQWLMKTDFKPVVGQKFQFTFTAKPGSKYDGVVNCEVLEIIPYSRLSYSWDGHLQDKSRYFNSVVVWTLIPKNNGTELQLEHNGFEMLEDILNHTNGWKSCLQKMADHINTVK
ncbi:MAG TPA: SRPBCC domain-containing protein [Bacteroidia bacterium]|nr:SRPBCC domain-containing protein [Bacteroidia bacterium]